MNGVVILMNFIFPESALPLLGAGNVRQKPLRKYTANNDNNG